MLVLGCIACPQLLHLLPILQCQDGESSFSHTVYLSKLCDAHALMSKGSLLQNFDRGKKVGESSVEHGRYVAARIRDCAGGGQAQHLVYSEEGIPVYGRHTSHYACSCVLQVQLEGPLVLLMIFI